MSNIAKKGNFKIQLNNHAEFLQAWELFINLGYASEQKPYTCPYLYAYEDGRLLFDFFDAQGADLSNPNSANMCFRNHSNTEITLDELKFELEMNEKGISTEISKVKFVDDDIFIGKFKIYLEFESMFWCVEIEGRPDQSFSSLESAITHCLGEVSL